MGPTASPAARRVSSDLQPHGALRKENKARKVVKRPHGAVTRIRRTNSMHGVPGTVPVPRSVRVSIRRSDRPCLDRDGGVLSPGDLATTQLRQHIVIIVLTP